MKTLIYRGIIGLLFAAAGAYVGFFALHPMVNVVALGIAAILFFTGGAIADLDDVAAAIKAVVTLKGTWPTP